MNIKNTICTRLYKVKKFFFKLKDFVSLARVCLVWRKKSLLKNLKGNSVVLLNKFDYIRHIEGILKNFNNFEKVSLKKGILNFAVNHEEHINKQLRSISKNGSLTEQQYKNVKVVGSNPGILYGLCKVHKTVVDVSAFPSYSFCNRNTNI